MSPSSPIWWVVAGCTLFHFLWAGALIGALALIVRTLLPQDAFRARYTFGLVVFVGLIALAPLLGWRIVNQIERRRAAPLVAESIEPLPDVVTRGEPLNLPSVAASSMAKTANTRSPLAGAMATILANAGPWLVSLWLVGSGVMLASLLTGLLHAARIRRRASVLEHGPPVAACRTLASSLEMKPVPIGVCTDIDSPILVGMLRPMILLPSAGMHAWSRHELEMVLLHELSHVRRRDNVINLLQRLVEAVLFFQPAVWLVSRWVRADREECCDDAVVRRTGRPFEYAQILVQLAGRRCAHVAVGMGEHHLVGRVRRILQPAGRRPWHWLRATAVCCALLLSGPALAAIWQAGLVVPEVPPAEASDQTQAPPLPPVSTGSPAPAPDVRTGLTPWWRAGAGDSQAATTLRLVDPTGAPVPDAQLWIRAKWTPNGPDLRPGENRDPLVSDATGTIRISNRSLLKPLKDCDQTVPSYIIEPLGQYAAAVNLTPADWGRDLQLVLQPVCLVKLVVASPDLPEGRRITWTKAFVQIPGSSISYLLRQTEDASGRFHYLLPPGRYQIVAFAGSDDPQDACSVNYMETDARVVPFEVPAGQAEADLGVIQLPPAKERKVFGRSGGSSPQK